MQPTGLADSEVLARVSFLRSSRDRKQFRDRYDAVMAAAEAVKKDAGPPLPVAVARESVMRDAFHVLGRRPRVSDWRRRFRVVFRNEDGIDAGGVTREFFNVAIRQVTWSSWQHLLGVANSPPVAAVGCFMQSVASLLLLQCCLSIVHSAHSSARCSSAIRTSG